MQKRIILVWTLIMVALIGTLTFVCMNIKKKEMGNLNAEAILEMAKKYYNYYVGELPVRESSKKITNTELIAAKHDPKLEDGCDGYVIVTNAQMGFTYKAYVKCPEYTTEGYEN